MTYNETAKRMSQDPVVIFSMGKTGTTSLTQAIAATTSRPVVKAHALSKDGLGRRFATEARLNVQTRPRYLWQCEQIARSLKGDGRWTLLCGVRDPIAIAVSGHFYGLARQGATGQQPWMIGDVEDHAHAIAQTVEKNIERDWFREELKPSTGIDVYSTGFPTNVGVQTLENGKFSALILRAEDLDAAGPDAVARHLGHDVPIPIARENTARSSTSSPYDRFCAEGQLPEDVVVAAYETEMARHFYSPTELETFRARWTGALS